MDTFNGQILVDKLAKLNNTQQSIETLSHWCIFHRKQAKRVVETWARQFYCSPREQRVCFLYLANDILQNSRRKGLEFVAEFLKVLPDALKDVVDNGDEFGRNAVLRLVNIWVERKVFGSRGQILKEEILGRNLESKSRDGRNTSYKLKQPTGDMLGKLISSYDHVHDGNVDEDALFTKCQTAINCVEEVEKKVGNEFDPGSLTGSGVLEELQGQHGILRECIEQLKAAESSRATLVSNLREAMLEQEMKIEQLRNQRQAAQSRYDQVGNMCGQFFNNQLPPEQNLKDTSVSSDLPPKSVEEAPGDSRGREESVTISYTQQDTFTAASNQHIEEDHRKTAAAAMAAKLTASSSSAEMLSYVLSSLASEGVIGQMAKEDYPSDNKRLKVEDGIAPYIPPQPQVPPPPFPCSDSLHQPALPEPARSMPHLGASVPPLPPMPHVPHPAPQFMQPAGSMMAVPYTYGSVPLQRPAPLSNYPTGMPPYLGPPNPSHNFQAPAPSQ